MFFNKALLKIKPRTEKNTNISIALFFFLLIFHDSLTLTVPAIYFH